MKRNRLEAFSDGVIAILITIMVLEFKVPNGTDLFDILPLLPIFLSYILSFIYIGIYWNNHHHLIHTVQKVSGSILWANMHLLFWLSLLPFATAFLGQNYLAKIPIIIYDFVLLMAGLAYFILTKAILKTSGKDSLLSKAIGKDYKGKLSVIICFSAIPLAFVSNLISLSMTIVLAVIWLIPDKRIEKILEEIDEQP
jgi:uncharacterized membrane protein